MTDLQNVDHRGDVPDVYKLGFELDSDSGRRDGLELGNLGAEVVEPVNGRAVAEVEPRNAVGVDDRLAADEPAKNKGRLSQLWQTKRTVKQQAGRKSLKSPTTGPGSNHGSRVFFLAKILRCCRVN